MTDLPTGTVTFLFTDIEGSTRLWEAQSQGMRVALARHDALLRQAVEANGGHMFKSSGDAFCAAFATAPDAIAAALTAQRSLAVEPWPEAIRLSVRMAMHTGAVELRDADYFGAPLNRAARLLAAGHGGQTLVTEAANDLCRDHLPPQAALKPLGEHSLKDLTRREQVFQLCHPDLQQSFPPLKTLLRPADANTPSLAWAGLAWAHGQTAGSAWVPFSEGYGRAREAAKRALALAPNLAQLRAAASRPGRCGRCGRRARGRGGLRHARIHGAIAPEVRA